MNKKTFFILMLCLAGICHTAWSQEKSERPITSTINIYRLHKLLGAAIPYVVHINDEKSLNLYNRECLDLLIYGEQEIVLTFYYQGQVKEGEVVINTKPGTDYYVECIVKRNCARLVDEEEGQEHFVDQEENHFNYVSFPYSLYWENRLGTLPVEEVSAWNRAYVEHFRKRYWSLYEDWEAITEENVHAINMHDLERIFVGEFINHVHDKAVKAELDERSINKLLSLSNEIDAFDKLDITNYTQCTDFISQYPYNKTAREIREFFPMLDSAFKQMDDRFCSNLDELDSFHELISFRNTVKNSKAECFDSIESRIEGFYNQLDSALTFSNESSEALVAFISDGVGINDSYNPICISRFPFMAASFGSNIDETKELIGDGGQMENDSTFKFTEVSFLNIEGDVNLTFSKEGELIAKRFTVIGASADSRNAISAYVRLLNVLSEFSDVLWVDSVNEIENLRTIGLAWQSQGVDYSLSIYTSDLLGGLAMCVLNLKKSIDAEEPEEV